MKFSHLYFSFRCGPLLISLVAVAVWLVTGFNVVEGAVPFIGIQWSTFATFSFFFYLLMVNFQIGGFKSLGQLWAELKLDCKFIIHPKRSEYPEGHAVNGFFAIFLSLLTCICALFAFESVWVPLYDWFQFGSVGWPVYFALTKFPLPIVRNTLLFILPLLLLKLAFSVSGDYGLPMKMRLDFGALWLLLVAGFFWLGWVGFPHQVVSISSLSPAQVIGPQASTFNLASCWVFPKQGFFPQNTYTFYPCALKGVTYTPPQILGFFQADPMVHLVNVLTKFVTFAAVCYPAMALVRRKP